MTGPEDDLELSSTLNLVEEARSGNNEAVELLRRRYLSALQKWARGRLPGVSLDLTDTDGLVEDALLKTLNGPEDAEHLRTGNVLGYLRQAVLSRVREESGATSASATGPVRSPIEELIGGEILERFEKALDELEPADREAAIARIELDLGYDEIAQLLGKPDPEAARTAVSEALVRLAQAMKGSRTS